MDNRLITKGDSYIRSADFHRLWLEAVKKFTRPEKIYIIDSNSPLKPPLDEDIEELVELIENAGHSTNHTGKLCGVSRAHLLGMSLALANEVDYWVYIEQDALIYGEGIIERCIEGMKKPYMFGDGFGTPQPVQHSLMIVRTDAVADFIKHFTSIKARDNDISPEVKFALATSRVLRLLPESLFRDIHTPGLKNRILWRLFRIFRGFDAVPFGYGRVRPIDFEDPHFYFQHGTIDEIEKYKALLNKRNR
jgi:hypothetical protein